MSLAKTESIRKFYEGSEIFITGASGFIGKALIEKLLRSCPRIKTIYVLMRENKNKTLAQRIQGITDGMIFDTLREENPEAFEKIQAIQGDMMQLRLGICEKDLEKIKNCSLIIHAAASVRFDDPINSAIILNTRGTREVCEIAKMMPGIKALVHVSTAYIQPKNKHVEEILYETENDWRTYVKYAENFDEDFLNCFSQKLTRFAPNTYTFTKNMAEQVCIDYKKEFNLPIIIYRPSIVSASETEPIPGWCDNLNGPIGLTMVVALGINHVMHMKGSSVMNVVPVDICVKGIIVAAWKYWRDQQLNSNDHAIPVYNSASIKKVSYDSMTYEMDVFVGENPSVNLIGLPSVTFTTCLFYSWILRICRNIIPALIIDGILTAARQKPKIMKLNRLIYNAEISLRYFYSKSFTIDNFKFLDLNLSIPPIEKDDFSLTEKMFSNKDLYSNTYKLILKIAFGESENDLKFAKLRYLIVYYVTKTFHAFIIFFVWKILYKYLFE